MSCLKYVLRTVDNAIKAREQTQFAAFQTKYHLAGNNNPLNQSLTERVILLIFSRWTQYELTTYCKYLTYPTHDIMNINKCNIKKE